jgi:hypothetical protein
VREQAVFWLRRAADLAVGRYEIEDAVSLLQRAVELESRRDAQVEIWREIGHAHAIYFDGKAFSAAMQRAIELADDDLTTADLYAELAFQTMIRAGMWGVPPQADLVEDWIGRTLELAPPDTAARAKALIARCYNAHDKSPELASEASGIAERLGDPVIRSYGFDVLCLTAVAAGDWGDAADWAHRGTPGPGMRSPAGSLRIIGCTASARAWCSKSSSVTGRQRPGCSLAWKTPWPRTSRRRVF